MPEERADAFITEEQLAQRVQELGVQITQDYQGQSVLLVGICVVTIMWALG